MIKVKNLSKTFPLSLHKSTMKEKLGQLWKREKNQVLYALQEINFEVSPGEVIGIIGKNGAGKSTLLKLLSQVILPTSGEILLRGRVGALLEVGAGFHPELTGRENIFLSGAILGMRKHEITRSFDEIVAFAEIESFLDIPVKKYSSGMFLRLAFSVIAHLQSEILIVDEVLSIGDASFQKKCLAKMREVVLQGNRTLFFVSHQLELLQSLCPRSLWLDGGRLHLDAPTPIVFPAYNSRY
ncbi:MAG: ABC transporter ATP-binding protein [Chlamydiota bacterium]